METVKQQTKKQEAVIPGVQNRKKQVQEITAKDKARMDLDMETVQDLDDEDCTPWQRQLRVNAFMVQVGVRKLIAEGLVHVYEAQEEIQRDIKHKLNYNIEKLEERLVSVEKSMFGETGDPQDAFSKLRHQMYELEIARQQGNAQLRKEFEGIETKLGGIAFIQETLGKNIETIQLQHELTEKALDSKLKAVRDQMDTQSNSFKIFMDTSNKNLKSLKMDFNDLILSVKNDSESLKLTVDQFKVMKADTQDNTLQIEKLVIKTDQLGLSKADRVLFEQNVEEVRQKMLQQSVSLEETKNKGETCANYLEKYMPIYIQRQFSQCLEFVLPDRASKWRLKWFEEIKIPLLTQLLFIDVNGKANLQDRVRSLHRLITENIIPSLPIETEVMTEEEAILAISLKNNMLHSRGKLLIMGLLGQIDPKSQIATEQGDTKDTKKLKLESAEQVFKYLLDKLSVHDPSFKHRIMESEEDVQKTMQQALDDDQGTEAVMERAINAAVAKAAYVLDDQMQKIKSDLIKSIKEGQIKSHQDLEQEATKTQNYINNVHQFQIEEMQSFKDCHLMYLKAAQKLERKFEVIGDMELQYQTVMRQVKTINQLIQTLSSQQLEAIEAVPNSEIIFDQPKENSPLSKKSGRIPVNKNNELVKSIQSEESVHMPSTYREPGKLKNSRRSTVNQNNVTSKVESSITSQEEAFKSLAIRPKSQALHHRQKFTRNNIVLNITQVPLSGLQLKPKQKEKSGRDTAMTINNTGPSRKSLIVENANVDLPGSSPMLKQGDTEQHTLGQSPERYAPVSEQTKHVHKSIIALNHVNRLASKNIEQMERMFSDNVKIDKKAQEDLKRRARQELDKVHRFGKTQMFKRELLEFQRRVSDQKCIDEFLSNTLTTAVDRPKTQNYPNRDAIVNKMHFGSTKTSIQIGIKRDDKDAQGVKYTSTPTCFESIMKDGVVQKINQAAGAELQRGKQPHKQVFDQAAVFQSIKNVF